MHYQTVKRNDFEPSPENPRRLEIYGCGNSLELVEEGYGQRVAFLTVFTEGKSNRVGITLGVDSIDTLVAALIKIRNGDE
jgi:hypothetical protein